MLEILAKTVALVAFDFRGCFSKFHTFFSKWLNSFGLEGNGWQTSPERAGVYFEAIFEEIFSLFSIILLKIKPFE